MLRYPDSWWVSHIRDLSSHAVDYRSWIHRIAAIAMLLVSFYLYIMSPLHKEAEN